MSRKYFVILGLFLVAGFLFFNVNSVFAITYSWSGGGDGMTWTDPANWGTTLYPGQNANDDVIIATSTSATGAHAVHATSTIARGVNTLQVKNGWTLYIGGTALGASSTVSIIGTSTLKLSTSTQGAGTLNLAQTDAGTPLMLPATATFTPATGTVAYIGGGTATRYVATTTFYNLSLTPTSTASVVTYTFGAGHTVAQSATTTVSNVFTISAAGKADFLGLTDLLLSGSGTVFSKANGDFIQSSKVVYSSASATNIATGTYANLELTGAATKTLLGNTTATSTVTVSSVATLALSTYTFTATGVTSWTNSGNVSYSGTTGVILAGTGVLSNSAGGSAVTTFGNFDSYPVIHVQITDTALNFEAATAETITVTVTGTSGITDSETVTLTETTVSSGIFRGSLTVGLSASDVANKLDYQGGGTVSYTWTDSQDSTDTETASASFTGTSPGGGGGGGTVTVAATPAVPATPATPAEPTVTPAVPATPATPAVPSLESVQSKVASVVARIAALPAKPSADDLASVQAEIAAILVDIQAIQASSPAPKGVALGFNFVRPLALGLRHADVTKLQEALKTDSSVYPEGTVTGYFGPLTLKAVQKFQEKYGIASSGQDGYGYVGPKTRTKLNELFK